MSHSEPVSSVPDSGPEKGASLTLASSTPSSQPLPTDSIPDGGYGWICVFAASLLNAFTWGVAASYGVYLSHYLSSSTFPSARPLDYALIGGLEFAIAMLIAPIVTTTTRRLGLRKTMSIGVLAQSLGFIFASFAGHRIWILYLTQGVLVGVGLGFLFIPSVAVLPQWFWRRRTLAQGISSAGSGIGGIIFSLGTDAMIRNISLAWALRITGVVTFVANAVATLLLRDRNEAVRPSQIGFATYLFKRVEVLLFLSYAFVNLFGYMTVLYSLSNYATSIGLSQQQASAITAILNLGTFVGRPAIGFASDRLGRLPVAAFAALISGLSCFVIWLPCGSYGVLIFYSLFVGSIIGTFWMVSGYPAGILGHILTMIDCWTTSGGSCRAQGGPIFAVAYLAVCRVTDCFRRGHCVVSQEAEVIETISVPSNFCWAGIYRLVLVPVRDMEKEKESCSESVVPLCYMNLCHLQYQSMISTTTPVLFL